MCGEGELKQGGQTGRVCAGAEGGWIQSPSRLLAGEIGQAAPGDHPRGGTVWTPGGFQEKIEME